jgi:hypothetical protein
MASVLDRPRTRKPRTAATAPAGPVAVAPAVWLAKPSPWTGRQPMEPVNAQEWVIDQIRCHHVLKDETHRVVEVALNDLLDTLRATGLNATSLVRRPEEIYAGLELVPAAVPETERRSRLADLLDEQAQAYLTMDTAVGRLAALAILYHSAGAEHWTAADATEYFSREEAFKWEEARAKAEGLTEPADRYAFGHMA